jgi:hypothetical protein
MALHCGPAGGGGGTALFRALTGAGEGLPVGGPPGNAGGGVLYDPAEGTLKAGATGMEFGLGAPYGVGIPPLGAFLLAIPTPPIALVIEAKLPVRENTSSTVCESAREIWP